MTRPASPSPRRQDLLRAARAARQLGYHVRSSRDREGRVSSYYVETFRTDGVPTFRIRISDHDVPWNPIRDRSGDFDGSADLYATSAGHSLTWWRRAIALSVHGRDVPGVSPPKPPPLTAAQRAHLDEEAEANRRYCEEIMRKYGVAA